MIRFKLLLAGLGLAGVLAAGQASAANWLMLQGTEAPAAAERANIWGYAQPTYQRTSGSTLPAGPWAGQAAQFNQIGPDTATNDSFNVLRAALGLRGTGVPLDSNVNYFFLAEFGNNAVTQGGGGPTLLDASVTLNHIPGARIRAGQFKHPGSEEGFQAIHVFDYINFTNLTNFLILERFFDSPQGVGPDDPNRPNGPAAGFRDVGVQVFDAFPMGNWEHSYAVMLGNGNGIGRTDVDDNRDTYLYWSSERVYGGQGPRRQGWKLFAWHQDGKRTFVATGAEHDRTRYGVGTTYRNGSHRLAAEYVKAEGMIFAGSQGGAVPGSRNNPNNATASFVMEPDEEADGWYIDYGYLLSRKWELDIRYDVLNRGTRVAANERTFETLTLGVQYSFNPKTRLLVNYEMRSAEAPNLPANAPPNQILDAMDDRLSVQVSAIF